MQKLTSASPISEKTRPIDKYDASETDFYRMLKWSPDGSCLLALTESSRFDLFEFPFHALQHTDDSKMKQRWQPISSMLISNNVHDFAWYPGMLSQDPSTCCFAFCARDQPIKLWDAYTNSVRCVYTPFDHCDELASPISLRFNSISNQLICGFESEIKVFDVSKPGRECLSLRTALTRKSKDGMKGIISSIACSPSSQWTVALGTFNRSFCLMDMSSGSLIQTVPATSGCGSITQIEFTRDGMHLITAARRSNELCVWDLRMLNEPLRRINRPGDTNQRIFFDLDPYGRYLCSGDQHGRIAVHDMRKLVCGDAETEILSARNPNEDVTSCVQFHTTMPTLLTSCSGQRYFATDLDDEDMQQQQQKQQQGQSLDVWQMPSELFEDLAAIP